MGAVAKTAAVRRASWCKKAQIFDLKEDEMTFELEQFSMKYESGEESAGGFQVVFEEKNSATKRSNK